ncbi:MAG TPA: hypothetical protein VFI08_13335 [Spirochaetia bacterium]|nr:hypothetical protein [Spirochaetia bacterium]
MTARALLSKYQLPGRDLHELPSSPSTFADGCHYRMEVSGVESVAELRAVAEESRARGIPIHRVIAIGAGTHSLTFSELQDLAEIAREARIELIVIPGPRANFDVGSHYHSPWGHASGVRVRGADQLAYLVEDVLRSVEAGLRGFLFYGEEATLLFHQMRLAGDLPRDTVFKLSYTAGVSNPAGARLAEASGADSINPVSDLTLAMLAAIRSSVKVPLDIVTQAAEQNLGAINRFWDGAEIIRVCAPCYFKQEFGPGVDGARLKVKYCEIMNELVGRLNPGLRMSAVGPADLKLPAPTPRGRPK